MERSGADDSSRLALPGKLAACRWWVGALLLIAAGCGGGEASRPVPLSELVARAQREPDPELRARELIRLADRQRRLGDLSGARDTLLLARKACREISDPGAQAGAWLFLARAYARMNDLTQADRFLQQGRRALQRIQRPDARVAALIKMARAQAELKRTDQALATLRQAEKEAKAIPLGSREGQLPLQEKGRLLVQLALAYSRQNRADEARRVVQALEEMADQAQGPRNRSRAWTLAAQARHQAKLSGAEEAWQKAQQYAGQIEDPLSRGHAWVDLAEAAASTGHAAQAARLLARAEKAADRVPPGSLKNELQERIARTRRR